MPKVNSILDYIETYCKIATKEGKLVTFKLNQAQKLFYSEFKKAYGNRPARFIVLKARRLGISTLTEALLFVLTITNFHSNSLIVAHESKATSNIFDMSKRMLDNLPAAIKPAQKYSNAKELVFNNENGTGLDSSLAVMAVGEGARSMTTRFLHLSEVAFWKKAQETMLALLQTVSDDNQSLVVIESTANGYNFFHDFWKQAVEGKNDYVPLFFPWYLDSSYVKPYDGFELTDYEKDIKKKYKLSLKQLAWRRYAIKNLCQNDEQKFRQEYPISPEEAFIVSGLSVFNTEKVLQRINQLKEPLDRGYFTYRPDGKTLTDIKWVSDPNGCIAIYEKPSKKTNYGLGGDTAGEGSDYFVDQVLSKEGKQCATLRQQMDADVYTAQTFCLGKYYNTALLTIEVNFDSYPIKKLQEWGYTNMYIREQNDTYTEKYKKAYGFRTDSWTRQYIIDNLIEIVKTHPDFINDIPTLEEMLTFVRNDKGRMEAQEGSHDDLVMALAIAYEGLSQVLVKTTTIEEKKPRSCDYDEADEIENEEEEDDFLNYEG